MATAIAGPLSRFYAKSTAEAARMRAGVETWREDLQGSVAKKVGEQLDWDESAQVSFTGDLGDSGWQALRLFAFYAERDDLELPDRVPALLELDREWRAAADQKFVRSKYGHLLACPLWLPGDFPVTMRVPLPNGETDEIGSLNVLADQMRFLNQRTFQADAWEIVGWATLAAGPGGPLLEAAKRGFAGLHTAVQFALMHRLPVVVRPT
ncbi:MAG: hypothetical protein JNK15_00055 [Planctomycetes bacterium]|nr:hypothetical protein [Planctomycetota bacterium]